MKKIVRLVASFASILLGGATPAFAERDLETGVFLSRDPAGFVDGPNLYAYVQQNPWTKFDPDGLYSEVTRDGNKVTIKMRIAVNETMRDAKGALKEVTAPAETAKRVHDSIVKHWSGNQSGYDVSVNVEVVTRDSIKGTTGADKYLTDEQHAHKYRYNRMTFDKELHIRSKNMAETDGTLANQTYLRPEVTDRTIAHEAGREMGLGRLDYGSDTLMGTGGGTQGTIVPKSHIDAAMGFKFRNDPRLPLGAPAANIVESSKQLQDAQANYWNPNIPGTPMHYNKTKQENPSMRYLEYKKQYGQVPVPAE